MLKYDVLVIHHPISDLSGIQKKLGTGAIPQSNCRALEGTLS